MWRYTKFIKTYLISRWFFTENYKYVRQYIICGEAIIVEKYYIIIILKVIAGALSTSRIGPKILDERFLIHFFKLNISVDLEFLNESCNQTKSS